MAAIDHAAIAEWAAPQLGLITTADLDCLGFTSRQIDRFLNSGMLRRVGRGVHALAGAPSSPHQRLLAATMLAGEGAVASHLAAAWIWGFDGVRPDGIELSVPRARNPRIEIARIHRVSDLLSVDTTTRGPQPITTPARTLLDIAPMVRAASLEEAFDGARRRGQVPSSSGDLPSFVGRVDPVSPRCRRC